MMEHTEEPVQQQEALLEGEVKQLADMDRQNTQLTINAGNKLIELEQAKAQLVKHRESFAAEYIRILKAHGVEEGSIDLQEGVILVSKRAEP